MSHPCYFNPRPPRGGRQTTLKGAPEDSYISIHAPREGGDGVSLFLQAGVFYFNPRPPRGGRLWVPACAAKIRGISIHAPREGGDVRVCVLGVVDAISIHAPREGGDGRRRTSAASSEISIHAPREGGDAARAGCPCEPVGNFNPRPPRGGRQEDLLALFDSLDISIHAPREGGDASSCASYIEIPQFQSTPPARGATTSSGPWMPGTSYFNPRPPRGGRLAR